MMIKKQLSYECHKQLETGNATVNLLIYKNIFEPHIANTTFQSTDTFEFTSHALRGHYFVEKPDLQETTNANTKNEGPSTGTYLHKASYTFHLYYTLTVFDLSCFTAIFKSTSLIFKSLHLHFPRNFHIPWYPWNKIKILSTKLLFKMDLLSVHTGSMRCFDKFPLNVWYCHGYLILAIYTLRKITIPVKIVTSTKPERITKVITQITAGLTCSHKDKIPHSITETSSQLQICHKCHKTVAASYHIPRTSLNFWISKCPPCWR